MARSKGPYYPLGTDIFTPAGGTVIGLNPPPGASAALIQAQVSNFRFRQGAKGGTVTDPTTTSGHLVLDKVANPSCEDFWVEDMPDFLATSRWVAVGANGQLVVEWFQQA